MPSTRPFISFLFGNIPSSPATPSPSPTRTTSSLALQKHVQQHSHHRQSHAANQSAVSGSTTPSSIISTSPTTTAPMPLHSHNRNSNSTFISSPSDKILSTSPGAGFEMLASSPQPPSLSASPPPTSFTPDYCSNERRNSACSLTSGDKWWIGGKSSDGSERYYRLQPLSSHRSFDRISLDRLSI